MEPSPSSYRDPIARVYESSEGVFRKVKNSHKSFVRRFLLSEFYEKNKTKIVDTQLLDEVPGVNHVSEDSFWLQHEKIELITYPHEWGFETLKKVALFHLELQKEALAAGYMIKDASPYNVQFKFGNPIFIDLLSFEDYHEGAYWVAYNQFCNFFLNPLLIRSFGGVEHNSFFRGSIDGIDATTTSKMMPIKSWFSFNCLAHVHFKGLAENKVISTTTSSSRVPVSGVPSKNMMALWNSMYNFINKLKIKENSYWNNYEKNTSYNSISEKIKDDLVSKFILNSQAKTVIDLGCNSGRFSRIAFDNGAKRVIGLDSDSGAVDRANSDTFFKNKDFIALQFDVMNPSPAIGWMNRERVTLFDRLPKVDAVLCLALIHHICIAKNVPIKEFLGFLFTLSDKVLIEFVPKNDPMVKGLLANRMDVFSDYCEESFENELSSFAEVQDKQIINGSSRALYSCIKK